MNIALRVFSVLILVLPLTGLAATITAQRPAERAETLQLEAFVSEVLARNAKLKALTHTVEAARQRIAAAGALPDPFLSYAGALASSGGRRGFQDRIEISQVLPWPGKLDLQTKNASAAANASAQTLQDQRLQTIAAAKQLYAEWAYAHTSLTLKHRHRELLRELIQVAETRYSAGQAIQQDVLQAHVEAAGIDTDIISHRRRIHEVQALINALLNKPPDSPLPAPSKLPPPANIPALAELQRAALDQHPELQRLRQNIAAAESQLGLARKDSFPDFKFSGGYNSLWDDPDKRWWLGVTVNIPFDFSNKRDASKQAATAELVRHQWALSDRESYLIAELAQARARLQEIGDILTIYDQRLIPLARQSLTAALADYRAGKGGFFSLIDAQRRQLQTQDRQLRTQSNYLRELSALERYTGKPIDTLPLTANSVVAAPSNNVSGQW
ncbi:MAG: cobalt-zinc-cadmium efflux system outer membrane protein [Bermanella sp.]|jgi:cobalt-zinc-cadmium efflux system outer membrane protein